ncbi:oxidoreductase [Aurantimonas endophytica]|uniref:Uncharacterized protein n=1 Tax=Aurantimonas endophytica TaxID=1522175 RepID=A0A7W6HG75_9HYPH|nr:oxidoreductase [Aurantimonas endophytica]MBB4004456.1 hypothetical protein [Aurantimonas endophytica]MCO6405292.1 oxidoreductase [Aurantimonas endophytica]
MVAIPTTALSPTIAAIDAAVEAGAIRDFDLVIRGSSIGRPCERHLWYRFRWAHAPEAFSGRMLRLFETGHLYEPTIVAHLRAASVTVDEVDPETGEQWEVTALDGHFKGHLDGKAVGVLEATVTPHLLEIKTHNYKSFQQLKKVGVAVAKPEHVAQMQVYMHLSGLTRAFYLAKNKNDDELYAERIHYDAAQAGALMAKAERVLEAPMPLPKLSEDPAYYQCRFCPSHSLCHASEQALRNCRTCCFASPVQGGDAAWRCSRHDRDLSITDQRSGCANHVFIPGLVDGEQVDTDGQNTITYRMRDGSEWVDGRAA